MSKTDNSLKKMRRKDLLEILLLQNKKITVLEEKNKYLEGQLNKKEIIMKEYGNIAEASLKLNKVFEVAQKAADDYLESIKYMANCNNKKTKLEYTKKVVIKKSNLDNKENINYEKK